jgi:DHA3 family tetracycline resistance protein-like MFS transporter
MKKHAAYPVFLFYSFSVAMFFSLAWTVNMLYFVTVAKMDPLQLVLVGTALEGATFIFEIPTGIVADVYSRRLSIIIGMFLTGVGYLITGTFPVFLPIVLGQIIWGLGYTFTSGAQQAWITDEIGEENASRAFLRGAQF